MDVFAAISLCTEPPISGDLKLQIVQLTRISKNRGIIKESIRRNIFCQSIYQLVVLLFLNYFGTFIFFDDSFNIITTEELDGSYQPTHRMTLDTIMFHTFILMNLFNQINARVDDINEKNAFKHFFNNPLFLIVLVSEFVIQYVFVDASNFELGP